VNGSHALTLPADTVLDPGDEFFQRAGWGTRRSVDGHAHPGPRDGELCFVCLRTVPPTALAINPSSSNAPAFYFRGSKKVIHDAYEDVRVSGARIAAQ